jgi:nitrite reductase (NADH) large subunit
MQVTVVHIMPWLMERQLDDVAGGLLRKSLEDRGLKFMIGAQTQALVGDKDGRVMAVQFKDGTELPADLVVMAAGIRPNTELALKIGLHCGAQNRSGIVVSDTMQTVTDARIYAVGECAAHRGTVYGLVAPLFEQGKVCATHLAEFGIGRYAGSQTSTKLKVTGIDLFSGRRLHGRQGLRGDRDERPLRRVYKKLVIQDDKLVGACLYGDTVDGSWYFKLLREGPQHRRHPRQADVRRVEHRRHRPRGPQQGRRDGRQRRGLRLQRRRQGHHLQGHQGKGLFTLDEVRKHTKASASCGSCTGPGRAAADVHRRRRLLKAPTKKAMCGCTDSSHQDVRERSAPRSC